MLRLAEIIREGLKAKAARSKKIAEKISPAEIPPNKVAAQPAEVKIREEKISPALKHSIDEKEKIEVHLVGEEIEKLEVKVDEAAHIYKIGNIASLDFKSMEKCSTVMATSKVKEAIKEALLKKYELTPEELNEEIAKHEKKIKSLAIRCYIHLLGRRVQ